MIKLAKNLQLGDMIDDGHGVLEEVVGLFLIKLSTGLIRVEFGNNKTARDFHPDTELVVISPARE